MRKLLASRIAGLAFLYCAVFCLLVLLQFSNKGSFSINAGAMTIRGRYLKSQSPETGETETYGALFDLYEDSSIKGITGETKIYYGGLEFSLNEEREKGLTVYGADGAASVNPEYLILKDNVARFVLPDGTVLVFNSFNSQRTSELRISAEFSEKISEVTIPIIPRRSSLIRDNGQIGIMYSGSRFLFSGSGGELENGYITLNRENKSISYRSRGKQKAFNAADYIIPQSKNYDASLDNLKNSNFNYWNQNAAFLQNEDEIIAYLVQALARGNFQEASAAIPRDFINSPSHTYRSSCFTGGMLNAYRLFTDGEKEKLNLITQLTKEKSLAVLKEEHILDYLFTRSNVSLANDVINIIENADADSLIIDYCPGLLEVTSDIKRWRPSLDNPVEHLNEQIIYLLSENLTRDSKHDLVFAFDFEGMNLNFSLRLGKALMQWEEAKNTEWEAIGKSLVLSALESGGTSAGKLYNTLKAGDYYPGAAWLTDNSQWAWTVSASPKLSYIDGNINIALSFPVNMTHYVMIRGIRPFIKLQLYGADWKSETQFERSDSSGWVYYPQDQLLIVKLKHRSSVENIRIIYRAEEPPPPVIEEPDYTDSWGSNNYQWY